MNILLDTNILARHAQPSHPQHTVAVTSTDALDNRGEQLCVVPQVLYEFWVVATRPASANGLGLSVAEAARELARLKGLFTFLPDSAGLYLDWERLVTLHQVTGKNAHDARLVAAMSVHGLTHLLTFNTADFARFPGVTALDPAAVAASAPPSP
ncbi:MAG TPA: type II toxin-antitoxin system VapC family toxin [Gemmataceae bacterium]|jgi:predicted nucleic acid-binding protein|nr:type II toxin-antitoxin system VapC family toxin [Gemmataceae bacterium]